MFRIAEPQEALQTAADMVTDEAGALELVGRSPFLVEGSTQNFKVTGGRNIALAAAVLQSRLKSHRVGAAMISVCQIRTLSSQ